MDGVSGGKVGFSDGGHSETPGEATADIGGIAAPEFNVMESVDGESVGHGVNSNKVRVSHQLELGSHGLSFGMSTHVGERKWGGFEEMKK